MILYALGTNSFLKKLMVMLSTSHESIEHTQQFGATNVVFKFFMWLIKNLYVFFLYEEFQEVVEDEKSTRVNDVHGEKVSKRKAKSLSAEEHAEVMSTVNSVDKRSTRRAKQTHADPNITVETCGHMQSRVAKTKSKAKSNTKKEPPLNTNKVSGTSLTTLTYTYLLPSSHIIQFIKRKKL